MRIQLYASERILKQITGRALVDFLEKYGEGAFMRKQMLIQSGMHWIIVDPEEKQEGIISKKVEIGEYEI